MPAPLRIRSSLRFRTQSPNSLTCQSLWTWAGLSHQVCLPCVLMTPLSQFITYLSLPADVPMTEPSAGLSVRNGTVGVVIEVKSSRRDGGTRAERSTAQESGFQSEVFRQFTRFQFKLKYTQTSNLTQEILIHKICFNNNLIILSICLYYVSTLQMKHICSDSKGSFMLLGLGCMHGFNYSVSFVCSCTLTKLDEQ